MRRDAQWTCRMRQVLSASEPYSPGEYGANIESKPVLPVYLPALFCSPPGGYISRVINAARASEQCITNCRLRDARRVHEKRASSGRARLDVVHDPRPDPATTPRLGMPHLGIEDLEALWGKTFETLRYLRRDTVCQLASKSPYRKLVSRCVAPDAYSRILN